MYWLDNFNWFNQLVRGWLYVIEPIRSGPNNSVFSWAFAILLSPIGDSITGFLQYWNLYAIFPPSLQDDIADLLHKFLFDVFGNVPLLAVILGFGLVLLMIIHLIKLIVEAIPII